MKVTTKSFSPLKFASATVYYILTVLGLVVLTYFYVLSNVANITNLSDPLTFAFAIFALGLLISFLYSLANCILSWLMFFLCKKRMGVLCKLKPAETTVIAVLACLTVGVALSHHARNYPELDFAVKMIFSLPISKITFVNSNITSVSTDLSDLLSQTFTTWVFIFYIAIELLVLTLFEGATIFVNIVLIVLALYLALHSKRKRIKHHQDT